MGLLDIFSLDWSFLSLLGLFIVVYYAIYIILPWFLDSDIHLAFVEKFGKPIDSLAGNVVWITGASSGIGEHLAYSLAKANCKLILTARREKELQNVKSKCLSDNPNLKDDDIMVLPLDICDVSKHKKAFEDVLQHFEHLNILVNNAGRSQRATWENIDLQVDKDLFQLNVFSVLSLTRTVLPHFLKRNSGHVVVMSSCVGKFGIPFSASYTGSKHCLHGYFECLRNEKMETNIDITMVCPGPVQTNFLQEAFTGNPNEKFGEPTPVSNNKVSVSRCAHLMAIGMANKLPEVWICSPGILQLLYLNAYYPNAGYLIIKRLGARFIQKLRDNKQTVKND